MPLTPMMPGCPPLTPNGPPYHYSEPIPPAPSLSASHSQPAFQPKLHQQYPTTHHQATHDLGSSALLGHSSVTLPQHKQQAHTHFSSNQYQESYPHSVTQTYQQPLQQPQLHPTTTSYLSSAANISSLPHYTQPPSQAAQSYLNGTQQVSFIAIINFLFAVLRHVQFIMQNAKLLQVSGYSSLPSSLPSHHPNGTYNTIATTYGTQLAHHNYPGLQTTIASLPSGPSYSSTSYSLGTIGSAAQSVLPYSSVQSTYTTTGATYSTVGSSFTTSGISSGLYIIYTFVFVFQPTNLHYHY